MLLLSLLSLIAACGAGQSTEDMDRSMAEFRLAASLHQEGNVPAAMERLNAAIQLDPENGEAHILLGYIYLQRGAATEAETQLRKGVDILAGQEAEGGTLPEARNMLGLALLDQDRYDEAVEVFEAAARDMLNRQPWNAWGNVGRAYYEKGAYDESVTALRQAVEIQPQFCVGHYLLGQTYFAQEKFTDADLSLTSALEANPICESYQGAYRLRGETRARLGNRDDAITDLERCVELGDDNPDGAACRRLLDGI
ncbi:MAG: hypothetical protein DRJ42_03045 [Deltaproteobacteria bacterium]|nr:MAG: hypothetical protein DRJ42_03045 [Deltaproteobacteria bacterium]